MFSGLVRPENPLSSCSVEKKVLNGPEAQISLFFAGSRASVYIYI